MQKRSIVVLILLLAIGFATVSTTLILNGTVGIQTNQDNYIDGLVFDEKSLRSSDGTIAEISASGRTISFVTQEMTKVNETATVYFKIKNYSQYNATLGKPAISCYYVDNHEVDKKAISTGTTHDYMELIPGPELNGDTINAGGDLSEESSVIVRQTKSYIGDLQEVKFQCVINATAFDSDKTNVEKPKRYELTVDVNNNGISDIGDEITIGTESFYVISHTNTKLNALAKYNLKVGNIYSADGETLEEKILSTEEGYGRQDIKMRGYVHGERRYGTVRFSNANGWSSVTSIDIKQYDGPVKNALYGENGYEKYINQIMPDANISVRLITKKEIEELINDGNKLSEGSIRSKAATKRYSWIHSTSYWTQSNSGTEGLWRVYSIGHINPYNYLYDSYDGVRPVIEIPIT